VEGWVLSSRRARGKTRKEHRFCVRAARGKTRGEYMVMKLIN
jgi:hypothetical protein